MALIITTPPSEEPVTLAEVKARLNLTTTADDAKLTQQITVAREFAEKVTRRSLAVKSYSYFMDRFPYYREPIRLPVPPLIAVANIFFLDNTLTKQTWDPAEYYVAAMQSPALIITVPGIVYPDAGLVPGAVEIDFTAGYGGEGVEPIPEHIKEGIRQLTVHVYEHPEAVTSEGLKEAPLALMSFFNANKIYVF